MLSALRSTLEDPSGAATTSGAAQEPSAPVMPQLLLAGAPPVPAYVGCVSDSDCNQVPRAANARRDYPRGGASVCALDRRGPERRANRALDELRLWEQRRRSNSAVVCNGGRAHYNRVSTSPCPESRAGGCEAEDLTGHGPRVC